MRLNFVIAYKRDDKYIAFSDSITNIERQNLKPQFDRLCNASNFTGGKPYIIQWCPSKSTAQKLADNWNDDFRNNGTLLDLKSI